MSAPPDDDLSSDPPAAGTIAIPPAAWFDRFLGRDVEAVASTPDGHPLSNRASERWRVAEVRRLPDHSVPADGASWSSFSLLFEAERHAAQGVFRITAPAPERRAVALFCAPVITPDGRPAMEAVVHHRAP